jgi:integrase
MFYITCKLFIFRLSKNVYNQSFLALYCGLRFEEIANLTRADIDLKAGIIKVIDAKGDRINVPHFFTQLKRTKSLPRQS